MYKNLPGGRVFRCALQKRVTVHSQGNAGSRRTQCQGLSQSQLFLPNAACYRYGYNGSPVVGVGISITHRSFAKESIGLGITVTRKKGKESAYCYGCGADLVKDGEAGSMQTKEKKIGYWADQKNVLKKSQLKNWVLCPRCAALNKMATDKGGAISKEASEVLGPDSKMMEVFRTEVTKIKAQEKAVVVLCVDAINISGTLIGTIRNYVGGNPILLAVTRCDLLPDYVFQDKSIPELKQIFAERCKTIFPAAVYLCSEDPDKMHEFGGIKELAADLWDHLNGRDPYIIGAANIGKSTLTDILIKGFVNRGERMGHFRDRLAVRRVEKLRESRVTKSALPGTTLQNIRVPCFADHHQALWDTPGLLLDASLAHFPIRNFRQIRAQRPNQVQPHILEVPKKAFCLLIFEKGDDLPLLRVEVRMKKGAEGDDGPVHMVWNSTLDLDSKIVDIKEAHEAEYARVTEQLLEKSAQKQLQQEQRQEHQQQQNLNQQPTQDESPRPLTDEERKRRKEERRGLYQERVKQEQRELGKEEWHRRQHELRTKTLEEHRSKILTKLSEIDQVIVDAHVGMDITIANFGWIGFLSSQTTMIKTFAPSTGVRVVSHQALALPSSVGKYKMPAKAKKERTAKGDDGSGEDPDDDNDEDYDEDEDEDFEEDEWEEENSYAGDEDYSGYDDEYSNMFGDDGVGNFDDSGDGKKRRWYRREEYTVGGKGEDKNDPWAKYSGKYVGWMYESDTRFAKMGRPEGWVSINALFVVVSKDVARVCSAAQEQLNTHCTFCLHLILEPHLR